YSKITVEAREIKEKLLTKNVNSRPGIALKKIKGIVIHYTANPNTDAKANRNYFESRKNMEDTSVNKVSSHYIIGLSGNILRCIPDEEIAYASNKRNKDTLSIECCHPDSTGKFSTKTYQALIHLVAYLADRYEISLDEIIRHYDVTGKECPKYYVQHEDAWERLKNDVAAYLKKSVSVTN
ncbi:MAG: N-acetylmuramoyl-L-alanine amidase, partial [Lachnospiraceae bacterium]|nr:N-acetylmuramoyl-L-alanine amidase [Lachnospiraceae bacterium]